MAVDPIRVADVAGFTPEIWTASIADYLLDYQGLQNMIMDYSNLVGPGARKGDVVHIPSFGILTAESKSAATDLEPQRNTNVDNTIALTSHYAVPLQIEDIAEVQSEESLFDAYTFHAAEALMYAWESAIATAIQSATTNDTTLTADNAMTDTEFRTALGYLKADKVPVPNGCYAALNPLIWAASLGEEWNQYQITGEKSSDVLKAYGVPIIGSALWGATGGSGEEAASVWHKTALAGAMQQKPTIMAANKPMAIAVELTVSTIFGVTLLFDERVANMNQAG